MTTHSWGENPIGKWILEIHNDAYSNLGSKPKFFRWSIKLYGTQSDQNSDRPKDNTWYDESEEYADESLHDLRSNVVR